MTGKPAFHLLSALQFLLSAAGAVLLWIAAGVLYLLGLYQFIEGVPLQRADLFPFVGGIGLALLGLLLVPSARYALAKLRGDPASGGGGASWSAHGRVIWLFPVVLLLGFGVVQVPALTWLALPILHMLAIGIPIIWFLHLGGRGLGGLSRQAGWGVFGSALLLGPMLILIIEALLGLIFLVVAIALLIDKPGFVQELEALWMSLQSAPQPELSRFNEFLEIYFLNDLRILALGMIFVAIVVPIVEELLKPIGMLFLAGRRLSPAAGFIAGMLSGAAFALFESIFQIVGGNEWSFAVLGRMGTSLVHILNSGLVGWGIALAWRERGYLRLFLRFCIAVVFHGIWNGTTLLIILATLPPYEAEYSWAIYLAGVLPLLALASLAGLVAINRHLRKTSLSGDARAAVDPGVRALGA